MTEYKRGAAITRTGKSLWTTHLIDQDGNTACGRHFDDWIPESSGQWCKQCLKARGYKAKRKNETII